MALSTGRGPAAPLARPRCRFVQLAIFFCVVFAAVLPTSASTPSTCPAGTGKLTSTSQTCQPCPLDTFAATVRRFSVATCTRCPTGTGTLGKTGQSFCSIIPGNYRAGLRVVTCPVNFFCRGGGVATLASPCPKGTTTVGTGNDELGDCRVPAGSYIVSLTKGTEPCPKGSYCPAGPVRLEPLGPKPVACPQGFSTTGTGAKADTECSDRVNFCVNPQPCQNSGECENVIVSGKAVDFKCSCTEGYAGKTCTDIAPGYYFTDSGPTICPGKKSIDRALLPMRRVRP